MFYYFLEKTTTGKTGCFLKNKKKFRLIETFFLFLFLVSGCTLTVGTKYPEKKVAIKKVEKKDTKIEEGVWHTVKKGENLYRISLYYEVPRDAIKQANNMNSDNIVVGQKLFIPKAKKKPPIFALSPNYTPIETQSKTVEQPAVETKPEVRIIKDKDFLWPVEGKIICNYGELGNNGLDILTKPSAPVKAAKDGKVVYAGATAKYGETIIIEHENEVFTVYGHDMIIKVKQGQIVKAGSIIAEMKNSGSARRYLHFEIRIRNKPVNPLNYLEK
ncbi:MAG: peptidoglycan DD-metalloendopeptidase family protein [Candidatus Omnitrophica bacterium]|nr:peptidoglycan DD-metalloendopeptidase family protein [Candidatus Omnitrophota bacterium]